MSARTLCLTLVFALLAGALCCDAAQAKPLETYLEEAAAFNQAGDPAQAFATMEAALAEYPDNATVVAHMGLYRGVQAGAAQSIMEAGSLSSESFVLLDRAVGLDPRNAYARLYRGLMGVKVPQWLGKLDGGLQDLEWVPVISDQAPGTVSTSNLALAYSLMGEGYQKQGHPDKAEAAWTRVLELAPESDPAQTAREALAALKQDAEAARTSAAVDASRPPAAAAPTSSADREEIAALMTRGQALMDAGDYPAAETIFRQVIALDSTNAVAYKRAATALTYSDRGYDQQIAEDTTRRTNLVFEVMNLLDKSVALDPNDMETRLLRGLMGVQFPFFVNKLDTGMQDLQLVIDSSAPVASRAQAKYWLGFGYQKKGRTYWTQVVNENLDEEAVNLALGSMRPAIERFDRASRPGPEVVIEFLLGFYDDLPPQTAVWIENAEGALVRTLYISGFSGHAKQAQVVLPVYAAETAYADADAVTGASIDVGNHIYTWDLKDSAGNQVPAGPYTVKVEVTHWPTMKYQLAETTIKVGTGAASQAVEEGNYIPYLRVEYLP